MDDTQRTDPGEVAPQPSGAARYVLLERLGEGGMGVVWAASDCVLGRTVALKVLHDRYLSGGHQEGLADEARAMARLSHRNVVAVYDVGEREGRTYITMELVRGQHLGQWLETPRPWREVVAIIRQAGAGLAAAHAAGITHRDVKPSNILIGDDGTVRVADFGVARAPAMPAAPGDAGAVETQGLIGTPPYMSPERLRGEPSDARSDQFALCVTLYEALHGRRPFAGETLDELREAIARGCPPPVRDVPRRIHAAVARGLAADPSARFPSVTALVTALAPHRRTVPLLALGGVAIATGAFVLWPSSHHDAGDVHAVLSEVRPLTKLGGCAYSPTFADADTVVFDHTLGDAVDLYKVPVRGGLPIRITTDPGWEWHATSGRRAGEVAYVSSPIKGKTAVKYLDVATGRETGGLELETTSIAQVGDALYYVDAGSEYVRRRVGKGDEIVAHTRFAGGAQVVVARDQRVAIVGRIPEERPQLCLAASGEMTPVCIDARVRDSRPAFDPDGRAIYYDRIDGIARYDLTSRMSTLVVPHAESGGGVAISPDQRMLVWSACWLSGSLVEVTTPPRAITAGHDAHDPVTGANGRLAWIQENPQSRIVVRERDGTISELAGGWDFKGAVSFDAHGDRVAFAARGDHHGIYVTAGRGFSSVTTISNGANDINPTWTADGRVAFTRLDERRIPHVYLADPNRGLAEPAIDSRTTLGVRFSTDELLLANPDGVLSWWNVKTRQERGPLWPELGTPTSAAVSPDGRWLMIHAGMVRSGSELWRVLLDVDDAKPERVASIPSDQSIQASTAIDDDGRVYTALLSWRGELFAVPLSR